MPTPEARFAKLAVTTGVQIFAELFELPDEVAWSMLRRSIRIEKELDLVPLIRLIPDTESALFERLSQLVRGAETNGNKTADEDILTGRFLNAIFIRNTGIATQFLYKATWIEIAVFFEDLMDWELSQVVEGSDTSEQPLLIGFANRMWTEEFRDSKRYRNGNHNGNGHQNGNGHSTLQMCVVTSPTRLCVAYQNRGGLVVQKTHKFEESLT